MRAPATVLGAGLSAAAALLLTACGGSDEQPEAAASAGSSASSSAAAPPTGAAGADVPAFCSEVEAVYARVSAAYDPANVGGSLDESVAAFGEVQPPAELDDAWASIQQALGELRDTIAGTDINTPEGQATAQTALTDFQADTAEGQQAVERYVATNCADPATEAPSSAPSS